MLEGWLGMPLGTGKGEGIWVLKYSEEGDWATVAASSVKDGGVRVERGVVVEGSKLTVGDM